MKNDNIHTLEKCDFSIDFIEMNAPEFELLVSLDTDFDVDEKFGLDKNRDGWTAVDAWYNPATDNLYIICGVFTSEKEDSIYYIPTDEEKEMFLEAIDDFCRANECMNYYNFYLHTYSTNHAKNIDLVCEKIDDGYQVRNTADNFILFKSNDENMARFIGHNIELVSYGNDETYSIESLDSCEVIFSTDSIDCEIEDDEEMEM